MNWKANNTFCFYKTAQAPAERMLMYIYLLNIYISSVT